MAAVSWVIASGGSNGVQETIIEETEIVQRGKHNAADDNEIRYRTLYYWMTSETYDLKQPFTSLRNSIKKALVPMKIGREIIIGSTKFVEYIIQKKDFIKAVGELGIKADDSRKPKCISK